MKGGELLVAFADGQRLGGLNETACAFGKFFEIHVNSPSPRRPPDWRDGGVEVGPKWRPGADMGSSCQVEKGFERRKLGVGGRLSQPKNGADGRRFGVGSFNRPNWFPAGASHRHFRPRQHRPEAAAGGAAADESGFHRHRRRAPRHSPAIREGGGQGRERLAELRKLPGFRLGRRGGREAGRSRDKCRQGRGQGLEIDAGLFLTARTGVEARLLIAKTVATLPLSLGRDRHPGVRPVAQSDGHCAAADPGVRRWDWRCGQNFCLVARPFDRTLIAVSIEGGTIEIRLRLGAIAHLAAILLRLRDRRDLRSALHWRRKTIRQGDEIIIVVAFVEFLAIAADIGVGVAQLERRR